MVRETQRLKVLALTNKVSSASTRIRIVQMVPYLRSHGIELKIVEIPDSNGDFIKILMKEEYDLIWLQKKLLNIIKLAIVKLFSPLIVFDFDDNLLVRMRPKKNAYKSRGREIKFNLTKKIAKGFTCGNNFLTALIKDSNKPYITYPTPVPVKVPRKNCSHLNSPIVIGWVGLSAGFMYLDRIISQLKRLREGVEFRFVVVSEKNYEPGCSFVENIKWNLDTQEKEISKFDIGIMPLNTNSPYDKGKCSYKILQYMASGVMAVGEAYGTNMDIIKNGINGFLVYDNDWYGTLGKVISGIENGTIDYCKISKEAINTAIKKYSYEALAPIVASFLKQLCYRSQK